MDPTPAIGEALGRYRIETLLGRGGMGAVYRATDVQLERKVALKVLLPSFGEDPTFRARFLRESRVAASIDHPNVIPIYEAGDHEGQLFIAMRYVDGVDLGALLRREGTVDPAQAVALVGQLAAGLDAAHARGLVHRDVKPTNALVSGEGDARHVYLADFGLSKQTVDTATLSAAGGFVGTLLYVAPEAIRTGEADPRSDLYSLGCVLYECLCGQAPFPGPTETAVIYGHLEEPPPRVSERRPGVPPKLDSVLDRALAKDPGDRFASGAELIGAARAALGLEALSITAPAARSRPALPRPSLRLRPALAVAGAAALVAGAIVLATSDDGDPGLADVSANSVAVIDPDGHSLAAQVRLDGAPSGVASGAGAVWVTDEERGVVSRLDSETHTIRQTIAVGHGPSAVAVEPRGVWVANTQDGTLSVISPQTNAVVSTVRVGRTVDGVCIQGGVVWAASPLDREIVRIDPERGRVAGRIALETQPARLACGGDAVWASSPSSGTVTEISPTARAPVRSVQVGRGPSAIALGAGSLWVGNSLDGTVSRVNPGDGTVAATIPVDRGEAISEIAVLREGVFVSGESGTLARIDQEQNRVAERVRVGNRPQGLAPVGGNLWLAVADTGARHRGGVLRMEHGAPILWDDLDPAISYSPWGWQFLGLTNDGLTGFRREGGVAGATVVPNLAEALPAASGGGRTYAFRLRPGIRYSSGAVVRAGDFRFALERSIRQGGIAAGFFAAITGAQDCTRKRCDLRRGVATDDAARTVVIRLQEPDPDLFYKLAMPFAAALPRSVGMKVPARRALPATGPYEIARFQPQRLLRLRRNPRFASWSPAARPPAAPGEITVRIGADGAAAAGRVLARRADHANLFPPPGPTELANLRRRAPGQLRESVAAITIFWFLNTSLPPFESRDARRAVAIAVDREKFAEAAGGSEYVQSTCQLIPPNIPGSRANCPFGEPDLQAARRLVERSGTRGARVTVHMPAPEPPGIGTLMVRTLRRLGYRASLRRIAPEDYVPFLESKANKAQVGYVPWQADYPAPSGFLRIFTCATRNPDTPSSTNYSQFCDPAADALIADAGRLQPTDPSAAEDLWSQAERRILEAAPLVAMYNPLTTELVSERVGNYQYSPLFGMLLDRAWVR